MAALLAEKPPLEVMSPQEQAEAEKQLQEAKLLVGSRLIRWATLDPSAEAPLAVGYTIAQRPSPVLEHRQRTALLWLHLQPLLGALDILEIQKFVDEGRIEQAEQELSQIEAHATSKDAQPELRGAFLGALGGIERARGLREKAIEHCRQAQEVWPWDGWLQAIRRVLISPIVDKTVEESHVEEVFEKIVREPEMAVRSNERDHLILTVYAHLQKRNTDAAQAWLQDWPRMLDEPVAT